MQLLIQLRAKNVTRVACYLALGTIFTCYLIAVSLGHVKPWLPMISDCAVSPPEKYLFRIGIILSAGLLTVNAALMLIFHQAYSPSALVHDGVGNNHGPTRFDKISFSIASLGCLGLSVVGAVNENENNSIHVTGAVTFFVCFLIYMIFVLVRMRKDSTKSESLAIKTTLTIYALISLSILALLSIIDFDKYHTTIAFTEWTGTIAIILFNLSFVLEYNDELTLAALLTPKSGSQTPAAMPYYIPVTYAINGGSEIMLST